MSKFSEELIIITELAIQSDKLIPIDDEDNYLPSISYRHYDDAKYCWNIINKSDKNYYLQFADNAMGMASYGFYKANNGQIYIIEAWANKITNVYIPSKKWDCLKNIISNDDVDINS